MQTVVTGDTHAAMLLMQWLAVVAFHTYICLWNRREQAATHERTSVCECWSVRTHLARVPSSTCALLTWRGMVEGVNASQASVARASVQLFGRNAGLEQPSVHEYRYQYASQLQA